MMRRKIGSLFLSMISLVFSVNCAHAHHGFATNFDIEKTVTIQGTVTEFRLSNPHAYLFIDVVNKNNETVNWKIEMDGKITLARKGWTEESLARGDTVTASGALSRSESNFIFWQSLVNESGKELNPDTSDFQTLDRQRRQAKLQTETEKSVTGKNEANASLFSRVGIPAAFLTIVMLLFFIGYCVRRTLSDKTK